MKPLIFLVFDDSVTVSIVTQAIFGSFNVALLTLFIILVKGDPGYLK